MATNTMAIMTMLVLASLLRSSEENSQKVTTHFIESPQNITTFLNSTVEMRCRPNGSDIFSWTLNGSQIHATNLPLHITAGDANLNVLRIFAAEELNGSVFTCLFINGDGQSFSSSGHLFMIQDPVTGSTITPNVTQPFSQNKTEAENDGASTLSGGHLVPTLGFVLCILLPSAF